MKQIQIQEIDINKINGFGVYELRNLARSLGIPRPTTLLRADLIEGIKRCVREGRVPTKPEVHRGRPPRAFSLDVSKITDVESSFFSAYLGSFDEDEERLACCCPSAGDDVRFVSGYVHTRGTPDAQLIGIDLISYVVPAKLVSAYKLAMGDFIEAKATFDAKVRQFVLTEVLQINDREPSKLSETPIAEHFDAMEGVRPHKCVSVSGVDFKLGQRVLLKSAKGYDRIEHIASFAKSKEFYPVALLIEETDDTAKYVREAGVADVYVAKVNYSLKKQVMSCLLALFKAKQLAEQGKDVVLFLDCLRKLFRIYNNSAFTDKRLVLNQVNLAPLADLKGYFQSARQLCKGGSLTVFAYTNVPENSMEEYVLNEFSDIANLLVDLK